jgi:D-glycero-D-manno-heptose 1,7-bisphosphate phosphatase
MKIAFLDRDGVINCDYGYVHKFEDFDFTYKCIDGLKIIKKLGFFIVIVTNQAGIAKGYFSEKEYHTLTDRFLNEFKRHDIQILSVEHCPHHIDSIIPKYKRDCIRRKPKPGMLNHIIEKYSVNVSESFLVGDNLSDIEAAIGAGIKKRFLIGSPGKSVSLDSEKYLTFESLYHVSHYLETNNKVSSL